jgi:hypothetical protein
MDSDMQLSTHAYYSGEHLAGLRSCERLLNNPEAGELHGLVKANRLYYLKPLHEYIPTSYRKITVPGTMDGWSSTNPSIIKKPRGYLINIRLVNFDLNGHTYSITDGSDVFRTENAIVEYDENLSYIGHSIILTPSYKKSSFSVDGLEDVRLFFDQDQLFGSASVRNLQERDGKNTICWFQINSGYIPEITPIISPNIAEHEKNWAPILDKPFTWLYMNGPETRVADKRGTIFDLGRADHISKDFRGGSQLIPFRGGYLSVIHEVTWTPESRIYNHRFVVYNERKVIQRYSIPFYIKNEKTVEFAAGLATSHDGKNIVVSYGHADKEAWTATIRTSDFDSLF